MNSRIQKKKLKIDTLLSSDKSEDEIAKKLSSWFKETPELIDITYILERTIFHKLVALKYNTVLDKLLAHSEWHQAALKIDRNGYSILQLAVTGDETSKLILKTILVHLPQLLDWQNTSLDTALHIAVLKESEWAIMTLVMDYKAKQTLKNKDGKTPLDLAGTNVELKRKLFCMDLMSIQSIRVHSKQLGTPESIERLSFIAPALSSRSDSSTPTSTSLEVYPPDTTRYVETLFLIQAKLNEFASLLTINGLTLISEQLPKLVVESFDEPQKKDLQLIWSLVGCYTEGNTRREFTFESLRDKALGILMDFSITQIIINIRLLYPQFNKHQKLVANYIISQLLYHDAIDKEMQDPMLALQISFFCRCNTAGLGVLGEEFNSSLKVIFQECSSLYKGSRQTISEQGLRSFDSLIESAILQTRSIRQANEALLIAHEIGLITLTFYQKISVVEFKNGSWTKESRAEQSPSMNELTIFFNKLANYFIHQILKQTSDKVKYVLEMLIDLMQAMWPQTSDQMIDLHHIMMFATVFNAADVARLTNFWSLLSSEDQQKLKDLNNITNPVGNFKKMQEILKEHNKSLPYIGIYQSSVTQKFEMEGAPVDRYEEMGRIFLGLHKVKLSFKTSEIQYQTDIAKFLTEFMLTPDNELETASQRLQPSPIAIVSEPLANTSSKIKSKRELLESVHGKKQGLLFDRMPSLPIVSRSESDAIVASHRSRGATLSSSTDD